MDAVTFQHPLINAKLKVSVKPDQITWAYGLNTQSFPTYGGEVVQILSVFFDDMTISGTVSTVKELETIYGWFITYMQYATQGRDDKDHDQHPVIFNYPERNWTFSIWPRTLPKFTYDREVVAPTWTLVAAIKEPDATFAEQIKDYATFNALHKGEFATFGKTTADFGNSGDLENNPWGSASADPRIGETTDGAQKATLNSVLSQSTKAIGDEYLGFVQSYANKDFTKLPIHPDISKPPGLSKDDITNGKPKNKKTTAKKTAKKKS